MTHFRKVFCPARQFRRLVARTIAPAIATTCASLALFCLTSCSEDGTENVDPTPAVSGDDDVTPDPVSQEIDALTGARTRVVWVRFTRKDISDVYGNFENFELWGIDTADQLGERAILPEKDNYSRPLLSHNGDVIVYSRRNTERDGPKKIYKPEIFRIDWQGENLERLGEGYAVDLWRDPETGIDWVYTADLGPTTESNLYAGKIERFQLIDPFQRELVYDASQVSTDNLQLSRDGKRMSCLFPWPNGGAIDLETGERWQNQHGCWTSMAPDNSYAAWVFDGGHKSVHIFGDRGVKHSQISFVDAPGMGGYEMYHPRWSNHVRYFAVTGPYTGKTIGDGGHSAEILLGKFSADLKSVENWVQVTDNDLGDFYPDVWVEGGDSASLDATMFRDDVLPPTEVTLDTEWPADDSSLLFVWENASPSGQRMVGAQPDADTRGHECSVVPRNRARLGRHFEMLADGGFFEVDGESTVLMDKYLDRAGEDSTFAFEAWVKPYSNRDGVIFSHPKFQLRQKDGEYRFAALVPRPATITLGPVVAGQPVHLAVSCDEQGWWIFRDGRSRSDDQVVLSAELMASLRGTTIGGGWDGAIEGVAVYKRPLLPGEIAHNRSHFQTLRTGREAADQDVARILVKAKLVETTAVRSVKDLAYASALIANRYQAVEVSAGSLPNDEFVVYHWAVMDRRPLSGIANEVGKEYQLEIEPYAGHPEIVSQLRWSDFFEEAHDLYYDIAPPAPYAEP